MRSKKESVQALLANIQQAAEQEEYNPAEDFKLLRAQFGQTHPREFGRLLEAMADKYDSEWSCIHAALLAKARSGDLEAIRLYLDLVAHETGTGSEVSIVDDIG